MADGGFTVDDVDFEKFYQGKSPIEGADVRFESTPWDIGAAQPEVIALADSGEVRDEVLDAGCGLGNNAIFLAERGFRVTGVDGSPTALEKARRRAADHGVSVEFVRTDVTTFDGITTRFATVLDSALYHCLNDEQKYAYSAALHRVTAPGARLHVFAFNQEGIEGIGIPVHVSQDDMREHLGTHWNIEAIEPGSYVTSFTMRDLEGKAAQFTGAGLAPDLSKIRTDDQGRILGGVWHLRAQRAD